MVSYYLDLLSLFFCHCCWLKFYLQQSRFQTMSDSIITTNILPICFKLPMLTFCSVSLLLNLMDFHTWKRKYCKLVRYQLFVCHVKFNENFSLYPLQCSFSCVTDSKYASFIAFLTYNALDGMGTRINDLEQSINDLRAEMGVEGSPSPLAPSKQKPCEDKQEEGSA